MRIAASASPKAAKVGFALFAYRPAEDWKHGTMVFTVVCASARLPGVRWIRTRRTFGVGHPQETERNAAVKDIRKTSGPTCVLRTTFKTAGMVATVMPRPGALPVVGALHPLLIGNLDLSARLPRTRPYPGYAPVRIVTLLLISADERISPADASSI